MAALGVVVFLAGAALFVCLLLRRPIAAAFAMSVGLAAIYALANAFSTDWINHLDRQEPGVLLVITAGVFSPILAAVLTVPEVVRRREG